MRRNSSRAARPHFHRNGSRSVGASQNALAQQMLALNSLLSERMSLGPYLGVSHDGKRDIYKAAGYHKRLVFQDFYNAYRRQDVARRIVRAAPDESWRKPPELFDGDNADDGKDDTEFVQAWNAIANGRKDGDQPDASRGALHYLARLDRISGIGRYGVLYLGLRDGKEPIEPAERGSLSEPEDLLYVAAYDEGSAVLGGQNMDRSSPRFGLPEYYDLSVTTTAGDKRSLRVHWTRCLHVAEDAENDDLFGFPRLEACWNRVYDLLKIMAGSGEAAWKLLDTGHILSTKEGGKLPVAEADMKELTDQVEDFVHGLTRWLLAENLESNPIVGSVQDPTGLVDVNMTLIAAATGIPKRILAGSERGELSSEQDEEAWANLVATRQQNHVTPVILDSLVNRLIWLGVLPPPSAGNFAFWWPPLKESRREENAAVAKTVAETLNLAGIEIEPEEFVKAFLSEIPTTAIKEKEEPPPPPAFPPVVPPVPPGTSPDEPGRAEDEPAVNAGGGDDAQAGVPFRWRNYP